MTKRKSPEEFFSLEEAGQYAHVTRQAIYLAIRNRGLKAKKINNRWYTTKEDIDYYRMNKHNRDLRKDAGEYIFDMDKGHFSVSQVVKVISATIGCPFPVQRLYYLLRRGQVKGIRRGKAWIIQKDDAVSLLETVKEESTRYQKKWG